VWYTVPVRYCCRGVACCWVVLEDNELCGPSAKAIHSDIHADVCNCLHTWQCFCTLLRKRRHRNVHTASSSSRAYKYSQCSTSQYSTVHYYCANLTVKLRTDKRMYRNSNARPCCCIHSAGHPVSVGRVKGKSLVRCLDLFRYLGLIPRLFAESAFFLPEADTSLPSPAPPFFPWLFVALIGTSVSVGIKYCAVLHPDSSGT